MSSPHRQLFGTDGIRGVAGEFPLSSENTFLIGYALGRQLGLSTSRARVVIGQDTRESSAWIADRVIAGLAAASVASDSAGVITTPGVAFLARSRGYAAGVVISASHNPWTDNGIKVFSGSGYKLPDEHELAIEQEIFSLLQGTTVPEPPGRLTPSLPGDAGLRRAYVEWLAKQAEATPLRKLRVLVDCANGAATAEGRELFTACGIRADYLNDSPSGRNINENCGALHPETLAAAMKSRPGEFDLGVTFDGDADRALFCDATGRVVNGDGVLLLSARAMQAGGHLPNSLVVATTMSNMGLEIALRRSGIRMLRANVGDKYVLEEMLKSGAQLGGEQSGHILYRDEDATTGDGLLTALRVMQVMALTGQPLSELVSDLKVFPQTIRNIRVREKIPLQQLPAVQDEITYAENQLGDNGRVVVRYSGTEPLARVMIEAESEVLMQTLAERITQALQSALGA
jgi:phosphoglucosamine mutase